MQRYFLRPVRFKCEREVFHEKRHCRLTLGTCLTEINQQSCYMCEAQLLKEKKKKSHKTSQTDGVAARASLQIRVQVL